MCLILTVIWIGGLNDGFVLERLPDGGHSSDNSVRSGRVSREADVDAVAASWWGATVMHPGRVAPAPAPTHSMDRVSLEYGPRGSVNVEAGLVARGEAVAAVVCAPEYGWPWTCEWAMATVFCESTFQADAWATAIIRGKRYWFHGWFQIVSESPEPGPLADPLYNTERAAWKYINEGPDHAWPNCP